MAAVTIERKKCADRDYAKAEYSRGDDTENDIEEVALR